MSQDQHRATARILDILECLHNRKDGLTLTELASLLNAPKSSLFPILHTLEERRYLRLEASTGRYFLGASTYVLSSAFDPEHRMDAIVQVMKDVVSACGETCQLGILDHQNVLYIAKEDSTQEIRMISKVGNRLPANSTAIGKALLSGLSDAEIEALFEDGMPTLTAHTVHSVPELIRQLQRIRSGGIAHEQEESTEQLACWALPLRRNKEVFAAISISVPLFRCTEEKRILVEQCLKKAQFEIETFTEHRNFTLL